MEKMAATLAVSTASRILPGTQKILISVEFSLLVID